MPCTGRMMKQVLQINYDAIIDQFTLSNIIIIENDRYDSIITASRSDILHILRTPGHIEKVYMC